MRRRFEQHLAPEVVGRLVAQPELLRLEGEMREITALFTDIEGFTAMTERVDPRTLVGLLDRYFDGLTQIVIEHRGMVEKIVGDGLHAIFNAPLDLADHPRHAVDCAIAIRDFGERFRNDMQAAAAGFGRTRIGLETGIVVVGDVGGGRKLDYTAHGDAMNMAARLEAANKELGSSICIGPATAARLPNRALRPLGRLDVRGRSAPAEVFDPWPDALDKSDRKTYLKAVALAERDPLAAAKQLDQLASLTPHDPVPARLAARLRGPVDAGIGGYSIGRAGRRSRSPAAARRSDAADQYDARERGLDARLFQAAGSVGGSPGLAMLVPNPLPNVTVLPAAVTSTVPRATKTPKTPLLGPAKTRVPRMAISPNRLRSTLSAFFFFLGRS